MNRRDPDLTSGLADVEILWDLRIPLRDGATLSANLYRPPGVPRPAVVTLTPYVAQSCHEVALYFAANGYAFLAVDVRGRGNSEGVFEPNRREGEDGHDVIEWSAAQPWCNGDTMMWGGSYGGFAQWVAAARRPASLRTIVPVASPVMGFDFPIWGNLMSPYLMQWLTLVAGRTAQDRLFWNQEAFWGARLRKWFEQGRSFRQLDTYLGQPSPIFQEWTAHSEAGPYWDAYNVSPEGYAAIAIPVLTITGICDGGQSGALEHYRRHLRQHRGVEATEHYLVIGPWDHAGTRVPRQTFCGMDFGPESMVDLRQLHLDWYGWVLGASEKPAFLQNRVAYYVMGAERWRYSDSLEAITQHHKPLWLGSQDKADDVYSSGRLASVATSARGADAFVYDPRDVSDAAIECLIDPEDRTDQRLHHARRGRHLVYHSAPFEVATEISGFFSFEAWISIDQPDTDIRVSVHEIGLDGRSIQLAHDMLRVRYRDCLSEPRMAERGTPFRYSFDRFMFVSRLVPRGHRLRLVVGPVNSIYWQKNYNSGGIVADETMADARPVTVTLYHDEARPSVLHVPLARASDG